MKNFVCFSKLSSALGSRSSNAASAYLVAFLLSLTSLVSPAQARPTDSTPGSVHGIVSVFDPNGRSYGAPGAQVRLIGAAKDAFQLTIADDSGQYKFDSVRPGNYQLEVTLDGFEEVTRPMIVRAGETNVQDVRLVVKSEEDTAKAERVGLNLKDSESATVIKQPASETDPATSERLRHSVLLSMRSSPADPNAVVGYDAFEGASSRHFLRGPDQIIQAPKFSAPKIPSLKGFSLSISPRVSLKNQSHSRRPQFPDVQGFYPRDFQGNLANTKFGVFSNSVGRMFAMRFVIEKK
jgi:hypothetical protein